MKKRMMLLLLAAAVVALLTITVSAAEISFSGDEIYDITCEYEIHDGGVTITDCQVRGEDASLYIPATIDGYPVVKIGDYAFYSCDGLYYVNVPDGVTSIGNHAFSGSYYLDGVSLPNGLLEIGDLAFAKCIKLNNVTIPDGVTSIGACAFNGCESLKSIVIPDSVVSLGGGLFCNCSSLEYVKLPAQIQSLPYTIVDADSEPDMLLYAGFFSGCTSLKSVTIPESVTCIGEQAFYNCSNLTEITIPDNVTSIGGGAFCGCKNLKNVVIPDEITSLLNADAYYFRYGGDDYWFESKPVGFFQDCSNLESVTIPESVTEYGSLTFKNCSKLKDVFYGGTKARWDSFNNKISSNPTIHCEKVTPGAIESYPEDITVVAGNDAVFRVSTSGIIDAYQWQFKKPNGNWRNSTLSSATTEEVSVPATLNRSGYQYRCVVTSDGDKLYSDAATMTVFGITEHPKSVSAMAGNTAVFKVDAAGGTLIYQWQYRAPGDKWMNSSLSGSETATLRVPITIGRDGYQYRCKITCNDKTIYSKAASLTIFQIQTQPANVSTTIGKTATMKVVAAGNGLTYQWQYKTDDGTWKNTTLEGAKTATLKIPVTAARNGNQYRCAVKCGDETLYSKAAKVTVFGIKTQPSNVSGPIGKTVTMKVAATGTGLTYQWQYKTDAGTWKNTTLEGAKTAALKIPVTAARNGNQYRCVVKCGSSTINSNGAKVTVFSIKTQPSNVTAAAGKTATMKVVAAGTNLTYQWQYKAADGTWKNTTLEGAKTATLSIPATKARNGNVYRCVVKSGTYTLTSSAAKITVK